MVVVVAVVFILVGGFPSLVVQEDIQRRKRVNRKQKNKLEIRNTAGTRDDVSGRDAECLLIV